MPTPLPDDLFRMDKAKFMQLRDNPDALAAFTDDLAKALITPFKSGLEVGKSATPPQPKVVPAPAIALDKMFPVERHPVVTPEPVAPVPAPEASPPPKKYSPPAPVIPTSTIDRVVDAGVKVTHAVDHSVVHRAPEPVVHEMAVPAFVAPPKKEVVLEPIAPQVVVEKKPESVGKVTQSKDVSDSERRRLERETQLSGLLKKDQGELL